MSVSTDGQKKHKSHNKFLFVHIDYVAYEWFIFFLRLNHNDNDRYDIT